MVFHTTGLQLADTVVLCFPLLQELLGPYDKGVQDFGIVAPWIKDAPAVLSAMRTPVLLHFEVLVVILDLVNQSFRGSRTKVARGGWHLA